MSWRQTFVAKDTADLVDTRESSDQKALQMQLEGDAEVEVPVERLVMGHERPRMPATGNLLQHRRLDL